MVDETHVIDGSSTMEESPNKNNTLTPPRQSVHNDLPIKNGIGNNIGMRIDPIRVVQQGLAFSILGQVLVGDASGKDRLAKVLKAGQIRGHGTNGC